MRIIIITQGLSRVVHPLISSRHEIVGVLDNLQRVEQIKKFRFFSLIRFFWNKLSNRTSLESFCKNKNIEYRIMKNCNDVGLEDFINKLKPDLIVVYSMSSLLSKKIFSIPKYGTINLHPAYLPDYRGANPCFWQYYDMELNPGATVHYINEGEDLGDIIYQQRINIELGIKSKERLDKLISELGVNLLIKSINDIELGIAPRVVQDLKSKTVRARNLKENEHSKIINWNDWEGIKIWNILRGTEDWLNAIPQPKGFYKNTRWIIGDFEKSDLNGYTSGEIYSFNGQLKVKTKDGFIDLHKVLSYKNLIKNILRFDF
jgi:methionyl-tRNA formyltransferase